MTAVRIPVRQGSPEWLAFRRTVVTGTDIAAIMGLSPYKSEADVAAEKLGHETTSSLVMRSGSALEPFIAREAAGAWGLRVRRAGGMWADRDIPGAAASLDYFAGRDILECKSTSSRSRTADGLPRDWEAQVRWQMGCSGRRRAVVAALVANTDLSRFDLEHDPAVFADLVEIAADFRRRLAEGGPFAHNADSVRRAHPADDGSEIEADGDTAEAVRALLEARASRKRLEADEERLETAIKTRMGDAALMTGPGFRVTWKRTKDGSAVEWKALADELLAPVPETDRLAIVGRFTTVRPGFRPMRVVADKED